MHIVINLLRNFAKVYTHSLPYQPLGDFFDLSAVTTHALLSLILDSPDELLTCHTHTLTNPSSPEDRSQALCVVPTMSEAIAGRRVDPLFASAVPINAKNIFFHQFFVH
jgi:hypothetical protein